VIGLCVITGLTSTQSRKILKFIAAVAVAAVEVAAMTAVAAMTEDACLMAASLTRPDLEGHGASTLGKPSFPMHHHSFA
jgi:hypothetical protein